MGMFGMVGARKRRQVLMVLACGDSLEVAG